MRMFSVMMRCAHDVTATEAAAGCRDRTKADLCTGCTAHDTPASALAASQVVGWMHQLDLAARTACVFSHMRELKALRLMWRLQCIRLLQRIPALNECRLTIIAAAALMPLTYCALCNMQLGRWSPCWLMHQLSVQCCSTTQPQEQPWLVGRELRFVVQRRQLHARMA